MNDSHENTDQESLYEAIVFSYIFSSDQDTLEKVLILMLILHGTFMP